MKTFLPLKTFFLFTIFSVTIDQSFCQEFQYDKTIPGQLIKAPSCTIPGSKVDALFEIINRVPFIQQRNGYDVRENFSYLTKGKVHTPRLVIAFPKYYRYNNGPLQKEGAPRELNIYINNPNELMNEQSIIFNEETISLGLPVMFTDTFSISYRELNGQMVGHCINTTYISNRPQYVLNPRGSQFFKPITKEQYIKFWIGKLGLDIDKEQKLLAENKANLKEMAATPALKETIPVLEKQMKALSKWTDYLKGRKEYFEKKLRSMPPEEKNAAAHYALYGEVPTMIDKNGNYVENISGRLPFEPGDVGDTQHKVEIFTFNNDPFDERLPKSAFQLIVIADAYREGERAELRELLEKHFYQELAFKEMAALMYK